MPLALVAVCHSVHAADHEADGSHQHVPIVVRSRPVIERLPLRVIEPVDVAVTKFGDTLVADQVGQVVFQIDRHGEATLLAKDLIGLSRIAFSQVSGVHLLVANRGSGRVVQVTESGYQSDVAQLSFRPAGLGIDHEGKLLTANAVTGEIIRIDEDGHHLLKRVSEPVVDLVVDELGIAVVLLKSGKVVSVSEGASQTEGYVPASATRLELHPSGAVVALVPDAGNRKASLFRPVGESEPSGRFAGVPMGTSAFAFDGLGNLTLANSDLRAITQVTSHFKVPCPHCRQMVPMTFSPNAPLPDEGERRSF